MIRTAPLRWLFNTGHMLIGTFEFVDSNCHIFGDYSALDTCSYGLLHSLIRTVPFRWLLSTGHFLILTFVFADTNYYISVTTQNWTRAHGLLHSLKRTAKFSVTTQHWRRAHMDFYIRWFELFNFGDYSSLDTCSYGLLHSMIRPAPFRWLLSSGNVLKWILHSMIRTVPFRWLLSTGHALIWTFAFADSNCSISVTAQHWTRAHIDFCIL
jgi:hypothetical protein